MLRFLLWFAGRIAKSCYQFQWDLTEEFLKDPKGKIIAVNHQSSIDALFIWLMLDGRCSIVASKEAIEKKNFLIRYLTRYFDIIYVSETSSTSATRTMISALKSGKTILIFPEGRITTTGYLMPLESGTAFIAQKSGVNIYPVILDGLLSSRFAKVKDEHRETVPRATADMRPVIEPDLYGTGKTQLENINKVLALSLEY